MALSARHVLHWIYSWLGLGELPPEWDDAVESLRRLRRGSAVYSAAQRAAKSDANVFRRTGVYYKVAPELRLVAEERCPFAHLEAAKRAKFPQRLAVQRLHGWHQSTVDDLVGFMMQSHVSLREARTAWIDDFNLVVQSPALVAMDAAIRPRLPAWSQPLVGSLRVAT